MRIYAVFLLSIISIMNIFSQDRSTDRQPIVAGSFYPADKEALKSELSNLFASCKKLPVGWKVRAIISPHAGYVFSGKTAAAAISTTLKDAKYKNIFIIGSSHVMAFDGASVFYTGDFITPLGKAAVNREIANKLRRDKSTIYRELARNAGARGYRPKQAHEMAIERFRNAKKAIKMTDDMIAMINAKILLDWSPEQISGRLLKDNDISISHERIYQHILKDKKEGGKNWISSGLPGGSHTSQSRSPKSASSVRFPCSRRTARR